MDYQKYYSQYEAFLNTIPQLDQVEQQTGQDKGKVVGAVLGVLVLTLFAMDVLGTLIWLKYWVIFGIFTLFVDAVGVFYIKMIIFIWCMMPDSDGPDTIYKLAVKPLMEQVDTQIFGAEAPAKDS